MNTLQTLSIATVGAISISILTIGDQSAEAASFLYYKDFSLGTDAMANALANNSNFTVTTATSPADFETQINSGTFDVGIFFAQSFPSGNYSSAINALGSFVSNGGKSIYADWSQDNGLAAQFGSGFTGSNNQNQMTITDSKYGSGTYDFTNPGWGTYTVGLTALPGSSVAGQWVNNDAAIVVGNSGRSLTYGFLNDTFSDSAQGEALYTSHLNTLAVPEPSSTLGLLAFGALGGASFLKRGLKQRKLTNLNSK